VVADCHLHSKFSFDCKTEPMAIIEQAKALGLPAICITEHVEYDEAYGKFETCNIPAYVNFYRSLPKAEGLEVCLGAEVSLMNETSANMAWGDLKQGDLDFIIGSIHNTSRGDPYEKKYFAGMEKNTVYRHYLETVVTRMKTCDYYHVLGHFDYIAKSAPYEDRAVTYDLAPDLFDTILQYLVDTGRTFEFNTSTQKDLSIPLWGGDIFRRFVELGGEALSFGSDAHLPERMGWRFKEAAELAKASGIRYAVRYVKGQPVYTSL